MPSTLQGEPTGEFYRVPELGRERALRRCRPRSSRPSERPILLSGKPGQQRAGAALLDSPLDKHRLLSGQVKGRLIGEPPRRTGQARMPIRFAREDDARVVRRLFQRRGRAGGR